MSLNLGSLGMEDASFNFGGSYIMALDCGTTSVLATIVDEYGCIVAPGTSQRQNEFSASRLGRARPHDGPCQPDCRHDGGSV